MSYCRQCKREFKNPSGKKLYCSTKCKDRRKYLIGRTKRLAYAVKYHKEHQVKCCAVAKRWRLAHKHY